MKIFRVTFLLNSIASIKESEIDPGFEREVYFYENDGMKIFALVRAFDEVDARQKIERAFATEKVNDGQADARPFGASPDYIL